MTPPKRSPKKTATPDSLTLYLNDIANYPTYSREQEVALAERIQKGDETALKDLIRANLKFVVNVAKKFRGLGLSMADLINEGNIGLIIAAKRFQPERNVKFITYAVWWIRQTIIQALADSSGIVRLPLKQATINVQLRKKFSELTHQLNREPTMRELADGMGLSEREVINILRASRTTVSLEPSPDDEDEQVAILTIRDMSLNPAESLEKGSLVTNIDELLDNLTEREKEIIMLHFGLGGRKRHTLQQIGRKYNLTRERIRQIEQRAKLKMRRIAQSKQLGDYLN